jgi:RNA polymerase sigma factor (sigma-70 family)
VRAATSVPDAEVLAAAAARAKEGDAAAVEIVVRALQHDIFRLALRMTAHVEDAEDVTQEVLIKVITRLDSFRGESSIRTWSYRIAVRHILDRKRSRVEAAELTFARFGADLLDGIAANPDPDPMMIEEVKRGCTLAMLCCLDRDQRLAFILTDIFDLPYNEAADLCEADAATFRQRLSRARRALEAFTRSYCGLVNTEASCQCDRRVARAAELGRVHRAAPVLARWPAEQIDAAVRDMESLHDTAGVLRTHPAYMAPETVLARVREAIAVTGLTRSAPLPE